MAKVALTADGLASLIEAAEVASSGMKDSIAGAMGLDTVGAASWWTVPERSYLIEGGSGSGSGTAGVSTSDLLKKIASAKAELAAATGTTDTTGWKMTSVRWLKENHPEYVRGGKGAHNMLAKALAAMSYCEAEAMRDDGAHDVWNAAEMRTQLLDSWDADRHANMRDFLLRGGLAARKVMLGKGPKDPPSHQDQECSPQKKAPAHAVEQNLDEVVRELGNSTLGSW